MMAMGVGRAEAGASPWRMFSLPEFGGRRPSPGIPSSSSPGTTRLTPDGVGTANYAAGGGRSRGLDYDSRESYMAMMELVFKRGQAYGFIKGDKVQIIRLPPSKNLGHRSIIEKGLVKFTPGMRAFSVINYEGKGLRLLTWSELNPKRSPELSKKHIAQLKKLFGIDEVFTLKGRL